VNPPAPACDLHVRHARRAQLLLVVARPAKDRVRVRIDEAWREHTTLTVDALSIGVLALKLVRHPDLSDAITDNEDGDTAAHLRIAHFGAATRPRGAGAGDDLGCVEEEKAHATTSRTRDSVSGA
jgi:hypothetical protein